MRTKILISFLVLSMFITFAAYTYAYAKKCVVCQSEYSKTHGLTTPNIAWRDFGTPIVHKDGKAYATYKCASGHKFLVILGE